MSVASEGGRNRIMIYGPKSEQAGLGWPRASQTSKRRSLPPP